MIKYKANKTINTIERIEILNETKKYIFLQNNKKQPKITNCYIYFNTFNEAKKCLIDNNRDKIKKLKNEIIHVSNEIEKLINLRQLLLLEKKYD